MGHFRVDFYCPTLPLLFQQVHHLLPFLPQLFLLASSLRSYFSLYPLDYAILGMDSWATLMLQIILVSAFMQSFAIYLFFDFISKLLHQKSFLHDLIFRQGWDAMARQNMFSFLFLFGYILEFLLYCFQFFILLLIFSLLWAYSLSLEFFLVFNLPLYLLLSSNASCYLFFHFKFPQLLCNCWLDFLVLFALLPKVIDVSPIAINDLVFRFYWPKSIAFMISTLA